MDTMNKKRVSLFDVYEHIHQPELCDYCNGSDLVITVVEQNDDNETSTDYIVKQTKTDDPYSQITLSVRVGTITMQTTVPQNHFAVESGFMQLIAMVATELGKNR